MPKAWEKRREASMFETPMLSVSGQVLISPRDGRAHTIYTLRVPDWCNIVPLTGDGKVVMVKQYRYGVGYETLELPGGVIEKGESPEDAARRELLEETGYVASHGLKRLGSLAPNPPLQDNHGYSFLACDVEHHGEQKIDGGEDIEVVLVPIIEIPSMVARGCIAHALIVAAFALAFGLKDAKWAPPGAR